MKTSTNPKLICLGSNEDIDESETGHKESATMTATQLARKTALTGTGLLAA